MKTFVFVILLVEVFIESMSDLFTDFIIYERNSDDSIPYLKF